MAHKKTVYVIILLGALLVGWSILLSFISPEQIVNAIGVKDIHLVVFVLGLLGGVSTFSSSSFYFSIFTFALGGADPLLLALVAAPALTIGDWIFFIFGSYGKTYLTGQVGRYASKLQHWLLKQPRSRIKLLSYCYTGFTPLPGDLLMLTLSIGGIRFRSVLVPILLGNATLTFLLATVASVASG